MGNSAVETGPQDLALRSNQNASDPKKGTAQGRKECASDQGEPPERPIHRKERRHYGQSGDDGTDDLQGAADSD
jgi:hypothetical protein